MRRLYGYNIDMLTTYSQQMADSLSQHSFRIAKNLAIPFYARHHDCAAYVA